MSIGKRAAAEFFGTFWLVFGGCGSAVLAAAFPNLGIGFAGVALAFGLTVLTMAYAIGHISGCHLNPAVSAGLVVGKRFPASELLPYVVAQVVGGIAGAGVLYTIASGQANFALSNGFASNGYGVHSPGGYSTLACFIAEAVLTMFFLLIIMGSTDHRAPPSFAPIRHRPGPDADQPDRNSSHKSLGESGAQYGHGRVGGRLGGCTALDVLAGADHRRRLGRRRVSRALRRLRRLRQV
jgi:MIP family channel proteins